MGHWIMNQPFLGNAIQLHCYFATKPMFQSKRGRMLWLLLLWVCVNLYDRGWILNTLFDSIQYHRMDRLFVEFRILRMFIYFLGMRKLNFFFVVFQSSFFYKFFILLNPVKIPMHIDFIHFVSHKSRIIYTTSYAFPLLFDNDFYDTRYVAPNDSIFAYRLAIYVYNP